MDHSDFKSKTFSPPVESIRNSFGYESPMSKDYTESNKRESENPQCHNQLFFNNSEQTDFQTFRQTHCAQFETGISGAGLDSANFNHYLDSENINQTKCLYGINNRGELLEETPSKYPHIVSNAGPNVYDRPVLKVGGIVKSESMKGRQINQEVTPTKIRKFESIKHKNSVRSNLNYAYTNIPVEKPSEVENLKHYEFLSTKPFAEVEHYKSDVDRLFDVQLGFQIHLKYDKELNYEEAFPPKSLDSDETKTSKNSCAIASPFQTPLKKIKTLASDFLKIEQDLAWTLLNIDYTDTKVKYISNPIDHAIEPHTCFLETYLNGNTSILFLGMNPGPWGMCQTGVPFGEVQSCKSWLKIFGNVKQPKNNHPKRPIEGFACKRREVSGERFWGFFEKKCKNPETFFKNCFVYNHCPLAFLAESGKNITPPQIRAEKRNLINSFCDKALLDVIQLLGVSSVIGVGKFAEARANLVKKRFNLDISVYFLLHPSPASPAANKGWSDIAEVSLKNMNILDFL